MKIKKKDNIEICIFLMILYCEIWTRFSSSLRSEHSDYVLLILNYLNRC